jgi:NH3-dependent NAD+ synthetase
MIGITKQGLRWMSHIGKSTLTGVGSQGAKQRRRTVLTHHQAGLGHLFLLVIRIVPTATSNKHYLLLSFYTLYGDVSIFLRLISIHY